MCRSSRLPSASAGHIPYVLEENVVRVGSGTGFPVEEIARRLAKALGERGTPLAARLPVLRRPVCDVLIASSPARTGSSALAVFLPGDDLPVLTLNQVRLVLRIADAHGFEIDKERLPEVLGVIGVRARLPRGCPQDGRARPGRSAGP